MRTILFAACLSLSAFAAEAPTDALSEAAASSKRFLEHSEKLQKDGGDSGTLIQRANTATTMRGNARVEQYKILAALRTTADVMGDDQTLAALVEEIRKNFCDEATRAKVTEEFVRPLKDAYDELKIQEAKWDQKVFAILDISGGSRPGVNPGPQKNFFGRRTPSSKLPSIHDAPPEIKTPEGAGKAEEPKF